MAGNVECRPMSASLSPGTQDLRGKTVQYSVKGGGGVEWVINRERERENSHCGMQRRLCVGLGVSLPFLKKSKAPLATKSMSTCLWPSVLWNKKPVPAGLLPSPDASQKTFFNVSPFMIKAMTPNVCNPNPKAFGNVRAQVGGGTQDNPGSTDVVEKQGFEESHIRWAFCRERCQISRKARQSNF